jgi:hypothetical protein
MQFLNPTTSDTSLSSSMCVTIDGVWIGEWIYWPLLHMTQNYKQL